MVEGGGCDPIRLMELGGWKSCRMVKRYVGNLSDDSKRELINRVAPPDLVTKQQTTREEEKRFVCEQKEIVKKEKGKARMKSPKISPHWLTMVGRLRESKEV